MPDAFACARCGRPVEEYADRYDAYQGMHFVCFHYETEHGEVDVDRACGAWRCPSRRGLSDSLVEWMDWDGAGFLLGQAIGLFREERERWLSYKGILWTDNPVGEALHKTLLVLVESGILERRDVEDEQFRWNPGLGERYR